MLMQEFFEVTTRLLMKLGSAMAKKRQIIGIAIIRFLALYDMAISPNDTAQARRGKDVQHGTQPQSRRCLKQPGSATQPLYSYFSANFGKSSATLSSSQIVPDGSLG